MESNPHILINYTKEELIRYILIMSLSRKDKEIMSAVQAGTYNTEYLLCKVYARSSVQHFIRHAHSLNLLKKEYIHTGNKVKAVLSIKDPLENLDIKDETLEPITA